MTAGRLKKWSNRGKSLHLLGILGGVQKVCMGLRYLEKTSCHSKDAEMVVVWCYSMFSKAIREGVNERTADDILFL